MAQVSNSTVTELKPGISFRDACIVLVKTEWNHHITDELEAGCIAVLKKEEVKKIVQLVVPGAIETSFAVKQYWERCGKKKPHAFVVLGCVIRGDTPHFDYVCQSVTQGITQLNLQLPAPVIFGVLTVENEEQARDRVGGRHGHKGEEAAYTALKMIALGKSYSKKK